jgi:hypothetical protein
VQAHALAGINRAKYTALRRLYSGLKLMTLLAVGLVGIAALAAVVGTARKVTKAATRGAKALGTADRIDTPGVKEPSGIAFYPPTGHLFVVGDEGLIAELDGNGKVLKTTKIEAQIEGRDRSHAVGDAHPRFRVPVGAHPLRPGQRPGDEALAPGFGRDARHDDHRSQPGIRGSGLPSGRPASPAAASST